MGKRVAAVVLLVALAGLAPGQIDDKKGTPVKPTREWTGLVRDEAREKDRPKGSVVTEARALEALWKAWRLEDKLPAIDFAKEFVLVSTAGGPNRPRVTARLDEKGNLQVSVVATLIGGPGFGYSIAVFQRKGITSVNGRPLER